MIETWSRAFGGGDELRKVRSRDCRGDELEAIQGENFRLETGAGRIEEKSVGGGRGLRAQRLRDYFSLRCGANRGARCRRWP